MCKFTKCLVECSNVRPEEIRDGEEGEWAEVDLRFGRHADPVADAFSFPSLCTALYSTCTAKYVCSCYCNPRGARLITIP